MAKAFKGLHMARKVPVGIIVPQYRLSTVGHMFVPKRTRLHRFKHRRLNPPPDLERHFDRRAIPIPLLLSLGALFADDSIRQQLDVGAKTGL